MSFVQTSSFKPQTQDRIIGLILFLAACITIYSIYIVKSKRLSIEEWPYYFATIDQSSGLEVNAGVEIGNVLEVKLQKDTSVRLKLILNQKYNTFYTQHSYLKIDRELAINTVLEGSSLIFYPGKSTNIMMSGTSFSIKEPKSINNIVDEWQADKVVHKAKNMIANLQSNTQAIKQDNAPIEL
jgi:hypothetical protein